MLWRENKSFKRFALTLLQAFALRKCLLIGFSLFDLVLIFPGKIHASSPLLLSVSVYFFSFFVIFIWIQNILLAKFLLLPHPSSSPLCICALLFIFFSFNLDSPALSFKLITESNIYGWSDHSALYKSTIRCSIPQPSWRSNPIHPIHNTGCFFNWYPP